MNRSRPTPIAFTLLAAAGALAIALVLTRPSSAPRLQASRLAGIEGAGVSGLTCQNFDLGLPMTLIVDFYHQSGRAPVSLSNAGIPPGSAASHYLPLQPGLLPGANAAISQADRLLGCLARTDWPLSGGAVLLNESPEGTEIILPGVMKAHEGRSSRVSIQNSDRGSAAEVAVEVFADEPVPLLSRNFTVGRGTSITLDLGSHPDFAALPPGTLGHMRLRSAAAIAVNQIVDLTASPRGVYSVEGQPSTRASDTLFAPSVHSAASADGADRLAGRLSTEWHLVNPGSADAELAIDYHGIAGSCQGQRYRQGPFTLPAGRNAQVSNAPGASAPISGASPLPGGCTAAARLTAVGGAVIATLVEQAGPDGMVGAYRAIGAQGGGSPVQLPLFRKGQSSSRLSTAIYMMNMGDQPTRATLAIWDSQGGALACGGCEVDLGPGEGHLFWPDDLPSIPGNMFGSARVSADQPLAVVVHDVPAAAAGDLGSYIGLVGASGLPGPMHRSYAPLLENGDPGPVPSPTRDPALPSVTPSPTRTPRPWATTDPYPNPPTLTPFLSPTPTTGATTAPPTAAATTGPTAIPTATPPTAAPTAPTAAPFEIGDEVRRRVPTAVLAAALQNPASINGWGQPRNPNQPPGPFNPPRTCLTLLDPGKAWHPLFNPLVFKAGCP